MLNINYSLPAVLCYQPSTVLSCCHIIFTSYQKCNILRCQSLAHFFPAVSKMVLECQYFHGIVLKF